MGLEPDVGQNAGKHQGILWKKIQIPNGKIREFGGKIGKMSDKSGNFTKTVWEISGNFMYVKLCNLVYMVNK